ncbi:MAG: type I-A CRISPR-associated protein Cas5a [Candidatus Nezhaarchaeales archaeon]
MYHAMLVKLQVFSDVAVHLVYTSASSPVYMFPPPTTLLGALAYPYSISKGVSSEVVKGTCSPAIELIDKVPYASAGSKGYVGYRFLERILQLPYLKKEHQKDINRWWGVAQRGGIVFYDDELYVLYIIRDPEIAKYAWGIVRIGRKESHVSVREVYVKKVTEVVSPESDIVYTYMYAPARLFYSCENAVKIQLPIISSENMCASDIHRVDEFYVPLSNGMKCTVNTNFAAVLNIGGVETAIPREYVRENP